MNGVLPDITNDLLMWTVLIGTLLPNGIAVINQVPWSPIAKGVVTVLVCIIVGAGTAYFNHAFTGKGIISAILIVGTFALFTYQSLWKPSGIAPAIERATTPGGSGRL